MATIKLHKKSKRQPCYRLSFRDPQSGKWRQKLLHCSRDAADQIRKEVEAEFTWYDAHPELRSKTQNVTAEQARKSFIQFKQGAVKPRTVDRYQVALNNFIDYYSGPVSQINRQFIDGYRAKLLEDRQGRGTNAELEHIKAWLRYCAENDWLKMPKIAMAKESPLIIRWLTKEQVKDLTSQVHILNEDDRELVLDLINLLLQTGARVNEILKVTWKQINLPGKIIKPEDKGNTGKPLYLSDQSVEILKKYKSNKLGPFSKNIDWLSWRYKKLASNAGEEKPEGGKIGIETTLHDLRRTCGAWLIQEGVDIYRVSKYLRHSSVTVTEKHYVDILPSDLSKIASKIGAQTVDIF